MHSTEHPKDTQFQLSTLNIDYVPDLSRMRNSRLLSQWTETLIQFDWTDSSIGELLCPRHVG